MKIAQLLFVALMFFAAYFNTNIMAGDFHHLESEAIQTISFSSGSPVQPYVRQYGLSIKQCTIECALRKRCAAFTYNRQYQRCDLLPTLDNAEEWTLTEEAVVMGNLTEDTRNVVLEDCGITDCELGEKCLKNENDVPQCVVSECEPLNIGPNMIQGSFLNYIGAKIQIHCTSGTATITNTTIIECERSGVWTAVPVGFCEDGHVDPEDPCDDNWQTFNGDCYYVPDLEFTLEEAVGYCQLHLADLVTVRSEEEHNFLAQMLIGLSRPGGSYWIGARHTVLSWQWYTDDAIVDPSFWHPAYPTLLDGHDCVKYQMLSDVMAWVNANCNSLAFAICQKRLVCVGPCWKPKLLVSSCDGSMFGNHEANSWSSESDDVTVTSERVNEEFCAEPWSYYGESCYFFVPNLYNSSEAEIFCEQENSDLVTLSSQDEHQFIVDALGELDKYPGNENMVANKDTRQSSAALGHESLLAVDGVYGYDGECWLSEVEDRPWLMVVLSREVEIHRVVINTRADCCGTLPLSLAVFAGPDTSSTPTLCGEYDGNILDGSTAILCHEGVTGQVVKIELRQSGILGLCEVEIYEVVRYSEAVNLALLRTSSQSSTFESSTASNALDGIYGNDPRFTERSCAVTLVGDAPWWQADLEKEYLVKTIIIKSIDSNATSHMFTSQILQDIIVYVGKTEHPESSEHVCGTFTGPVVADDPVSIVCATAMMGRFIQIQRASFGRLVLCEVEVYADATFSPLYWIGSALRYERDANGLFTIANRNGMEEQEGYSICRKAAAPP